MRPTVLYLHGYIETPNDESVRTVVAAYLQRNDHNVLVLDWTWAASGRYLRQAVPNCRKVTRVCGLCFKAFRKLFSYTILQLGGLMANVLMAAFRRGISIDSLHIVGHSLGGQMAGFIGRSITSRSNGTLTLPRSVCVFIDLLNTTLNGCFFRISALDPANPPFYVDGTHLIASDASMVDVIHTDAWLFGAPISSGTIDFWPNGGYSLQPGCPKRTLRHPLSDANLCSHHRSWRFWAESVATAQGARSFPAIRSARWLSFMRGRIQVDQIVYMGYNCSKT